MAEGLSTTACRRKRTCEAEEGHLSRLTVAPRSRGIIERYTAPVGPSPVGRLPQTALVFAQRGALQPSRTAALPSAVTEIDGGKR
jgi:hypothetical protein